MKLKGRNLAEQGETSWMMRRCKPNALLMISEDGSRYRCSVECCQLLKK